MIEKTEYSADPRFGITRKDAEGIIIRVCRIFLRLNLVSSGGRRSISRELRSRIVRICREEVQEGHRHSLSQDMFASSRRTDAVADDLVLSGETRRRRYERGARFQTLQPEVTTSSLLG